MLLSGAEAAGDNPAVSSFRVVAQEIRKRITSGAEHYSNSAGVLNELSVRIEHFEQVGYDKFRQYGAPVEPSVDWTNYQEHGKPEHEAHDADSARKEAAEAIKKDADASPIGGHKHNFWDSLKLAGKTIVGDVVDTAKLIYENNKFMLYDGSIQYFFNQEEYFKAWQTRIDTTEYVLTHPVDVVKGMLDTDLFNEDPTAWTITTLFSLLLGKGTGKIAKLAAESGKISEGAAAAKIASGADDVRIPHENKELSGKPLEGLNSVDKLPPADADGIVRTTSGAKYNWNKLLNKLEPSTTYIVDNKFTYTTDELGRVSSAKAKLDSVDGSLGETRRNTHQQKVSGRADRLPEDQGGHLFAVIFGGPGEAINLTPMLKVVNQTKFRNMERDWASMIKGGRPVDAEVTQLYDGSSLRPHAIVVRYTDQTGKRIKLEFDNMEG